MTQLKAARNALSSETRNATSRIVFLRHVKTYLYNRHFTVHCYTVKYFSFEKCSTLVYILIFLLSYYCIFYNIMAPMCYG